MSLAKKKKKSLVYMRKGMFEICLFYFIEIFFADSIVDQGKS